MKRTTLALAALAVTAGCVSAGQVGRHFLLEESDQRTGTVRFLSQRIELAEGVTQSWVTVTRVGSFTDPRYGRFEITLSMLQQMVSNFEKRVLGQEVFFDVSHRPSDGSAAKVIKLAVETGRLRALVEWTPYGLEAVRERGFIYLSAEFNENWRDNEKELDHGCVLIGAGLTTRPVIKRLDPIELSEDDKGQEDAVRVYISHQLLAELTEQSMNYLEQLKTKLLALGIPEAAVTKMLAEAKKQIDAAGADQAKCLAVVTAWETSGQAVAEQIRTLSAAGNTGPVTITLAAPGAAPDVAAEVNRLLAEREATAAATQTALAGKIKLLSDTIAEGDKSLTEEGVKKFAADYAPLITAVTTDDQVKHLASLAINQAKALSAATKLASLGYNPAAGNIQISVESGNQVKSLQATIDKRLGFEGMPEHQRYAKTGGKLLAANKDFAEKALAHFDSQHGQRLAQEHKMLAGGSGSVSDVAVPAIVERTVLREALYGLTSLNFVNVGTYPFSQVVTIPYSYRDTTAAGVQGLRRYENQSIRKAGVIQTSEEARPLPQKLAFQVSEELRLLMGGSVIDFDPVAENVRNIIRIVGEDTEAINMNELVFSADEAGTAALNDTLTAQCQGTNKVFVTTQFPVVRPRKVYDLKGVQVGATVNPLVVTLGGTAIEEFYVKSDGTALANGTYYIMDWNLGELRFVDQAGAAVTPANLTTLTVVGKYSTNAVKWDTDAVANEEIKDRYDRLLTTIGGRKAVISSDRYYNPNMVLMSATVDNAVSQARSFEANASRVATGLSADGSVGQIKGLANYNTSAPGLVMGDTRILVGERGNTRFRMLKAWSMNPIEQARDGSGNFIDAQESFGSQWVACHTPTQLKNSLTSVVLYSATGRVARP